MAIMEISLTPIGTGSTSLSAAIAACLKVLDERKMAYELNAMGTCVEGNTPDLLAAAQAMQERCFTATGVQRVSMFIKIDDRRDRPMGIKDRIQAVKRHLN